MSEKKEKPDKPRRVVHVSRGVVRVSGHSIVTVRRAPEDDEEPAPAEAPPRPAPEPKRPQIAKGQWVKK